MRGLSIVATPILIVGLSTTAQADTIEITAGTLTLNRTFGELHVEGPRGFLLDSFIPGSSLSGSVVAPGEMVNLDMLHMTVGPTFSIDGQTYQLHPQTGPLSGAVSVFASVVAPPFSNDDIVSVFAPFTFTGLIDGIMEAPFPLTFLGQGTVQVDFRLNPFVSAWEPPRAVFQFESSTPAPIPEPATLVLVGSGIAGGVMRRRRARRSGESTP